jgi:sulfite exporter TauE/SafE
MPDLLFGPLPVLWEILFGLFATGLIGGLGHCVAMCGPFVLAQAAGGGGTGPMPGPGLARAGGALLLPYHLGRATSYVALGVVAGGLSGMIVAAAEFRWVLALFLALAALLFAGRGLAGLTRLFPALRRASGLRGAVGLGNTFALGLAKPLRPLFRNPRGWNGYALGVALGFLPCGLLYAALAAAAGVGSAAGGGLAMLAFVLGTMPNLMVVGVMGTLVSARWTGAARAITPPLMFGNAVMLALTAWQALA